MVSLSRSQLLRAQTTQNGMVSMTLAVIVWICWPQAYVVSTWSPDGGAVLGDGGLAGVSRSLRSCLWRLYLVSGPFPFLSLHPVYHEVSSFCYASTAMGPESLESRIMDWNH
jgi:hypothetical protein